MTQEILSKCGYRCDFCLAYIENVKRQDQRTVLSDGWYDIYGFRIKPENIYCEGCVSCENPVLVDKNCPVRQCVISKSIENCSDCEDYICDKLKGRIVDKITFEEKIKRNLSTYEYENFVFPYESKARLDRLRKNKI